MIVPSITIDQDRVLAEMKTLANFSDVPVPAVTRIVFTSTDMQARAYLIGLFREAGLDVRVDGIGNTFARWVGTDPHASPIGTGSHTDAIPFSGLYDGTLGVLGALEAFRALRRSGFEPRRPLDLVMFTSEEPTRFGLGCLGSRLLSGAWSPDQIAVLKDEEGNTVDDVRRVLGAVGTLEDVPLSPDAYAAFVELHIEQGPLLERDGEDIGIVTAIAAPATLQIEMIGAGGHAGGVLMADRRDALPAAAELSLAVEATAHATNSQDTVATVGVFRVHPGAVNSIPARVSLEIDIRDTDVGRRDGVVETITQAAHQIAGRRGLEAQVILRNADPPLRCADSIVDAAAEACRTLGISSRRMVSRAYHDALFMGRIAPTGMIFIPCRGGVSHRPDEFSTPDQIGKGIHTLALTLASLAQKDSL